MARRTDETDIKFHHWMLETWGRVGGLITPAVAARMLNRSKGRITQMMTAGKLQKFVFPDEDLVFVSWLEVRNLAGPIIDAKKKKLAYSEIEKSNLTPEQKEALKKIADQSLQDASFSTEEKKS